MNTGAHPSSKIFFLFAFIRVHPYSSGTNSSGPLHRRPNLFSKRWLGRRGLDAAPNLTSPPPFPHPRTAARGDVDTCRLALSILRVYLARESAPSPELQSYRRVEWSKADARLQSPFDAPSGCPAPSVPASPIRCP